MPIRSADVAVGYQRWHEILLAEQQALFSVLAGRLLRVRVRHAPWSLRAARVGALEQTITRAAGLWVAERPALAHFSEGRDVEVLLPEVVG